MQGNYFEAWRQWLPSSFSYVAGIWVKKTSASANSSLRESLVDLENLRSSKRVIWAGHWLAKSRYQSGRKLMVLHHFSEELWYTEVFSAFLWMAHGLFDCLLRWLQGIYHWLAILFQVLLARSSLWCGRYASVSNKGGLLISWTSKGGDIFLGFSRRDTHYITEGCSSLDFGLFICNSHPLLTFNNVRMDPHCLSLRSRDRN